MGVGSIKHRWNLRYKIFREETKIKIIDMRDKDMGLKHADELQNELLINKNNKQLEDFEYAELMLFKKIESDQREGETYCTFPYELSSQTIEKLKKLDYVVSKDEYSIYTIKWGQTVTKKDGSGNKMNNPMDHFIKQ